MWFVFHCFLWRSKEIKPLVSEFYAFLDFIFYSTKAFKFLIDILIDLLLFISQLHTPCVKHSITYDNPWIEGSYISFWKINFFSIKKSLCYSENFKIIYISHFMQATHHISCRIWFLHLSLQYVSHCPHISICGWNFTFAVRSSQFIKV